jgi:chromate transporter
MSATASDAAWGTTLTAIIWGAATPSGTQLLQLFTHFALLSLLAVGGAMTTAPDMHRFVVHQRAWLSEAEFSASVALAQAAPGPNVLFVAVIGFNVAGLTGALATLVGTLLPSTTLAMAVARWGRKNEQARSLRAFNTGMAPITIGLLLATGWLLLGPARGQAGALLLAASTVLVMLRTRISPVWLMAVGAGAGVLGWV